MISGLVMSFEQMGRQTVFKILWQRKAREAACLPALLLAGKGRGFGFLFFLNMIWTRIKPYNPLTCNEFSCNSIDFKKDQTNFK